MKDVRGISRVNMFEQIKSPSGVVYEPVCKVGSEVTYRVKGTSETFETHDHRMDGATLDMYRGMQSDSDEGYHTPMLGTARPRKR